MAARLKEINQVADAMGVGGESVCVERPLVSQQKEIRSWQVMW
jgi:hypothetical protein